MVQKRKKTPEPSRRGRGRPPAYEADAALEKAQETFWRHGYAATSLDRLSAAMGMNRPSVYNAFGDKRALYLATVKRYRAQSTAAVAEAFVDEACPLRRALRDIFGALLTIYLAGEDGPRGCYLVGTAATEAAADPAVADELRAATSNTDASFTRLFERAARKGELRPGSDPAALGRLASATIHTIALRTRVGARKSELQAIVDALIDTACGPEKS